VTSQTIDKIALLVRDYDEAIAYFTGILSFRLIEDADMGGGKRWVVVAPRGGTGSALLFARATTARQEERIGDQSGGRVFMFLHTDDFWRDYRDMKARGAAFIEEPRSEAYGTVVVFEDLYGNKWDLVQRSTP
jgi:catechol 2,3-dioxygenase-like lactoylglutathione lyase family enzyme